MKPRARNDRTKTGLTSSNSLIASTMPKRSGSGAGKSSSKSMSSEANTELKPAGLRYALPSGLVVRYISST